MKFYNPTVARKKKTSITRVNKKRYNYFPPAKAFAYCFMINAQRNALKGIIHALGHE